MTEGAGVKVGRDSTGVPLPMVYVRIGHLAVMASTSTATSSSTITPATALVELVCSQPFHFSLGHASSITAATVAASPWIPANTPTVIPMTKQLSDDRINNRISVIGEVGGTAANVHINILGVAPNGG